MHKLALGALGCNTRKNAPEGILREAVRPVTLGPKSTLTADRCCMTVLRPMY